MAVAFRGRADTARVVAVVLNWNAWADTIVCVESLLSSQRPPDQIVICDNGSVDDSMALLSSWAQAQGPCEIFTSPAQALGSSPATAPLVLISIGENGGYAAGNNVGIRYAISHSGADYVWILNSDVVVDTLALDKMLALAESDTSIGIVGAKLLRFDRPDTIQALGGGHIIPVLCHDTQLGSGLHADTADANPIALDHIVGASLLVSSEAIRRVGLIDESYFLYREETDWCIRMRRDGWRLVCCTQASVWHKQSHSIGFKSPLHDYYAVRNMLYLVRKFYPMSLPAAFGYYAFRSLAPKLLRLEFGRMRAVLSALRDFLAGVNGRHTEHSDRILMRNYLEPGDGRVARVREFLQRAAKTAVLSLAVAFVFLTAGCSIVRDANTTSTGIADHYRMTPSTPETE